MFIALASRFCRGNGGNETPQRYAIAGLLDLNGDGALEIIVETSYYEGGGDEVYGVRNGRARRVLQVEDCA